MHPYHPFHYGRRFHWHGPSRIFWFIIGAGAATFWHRSREIREHRGQFGCVMQNRRLNAPGEFSAPASASTPPANVSTPYQDPAPVPQPGGWDWTAPQRSSDGTVGWNQQDWDENKERMKQLQKRAEDVMADMSESTLDSIVSTVETLKGKIAEHRAEREQQQKRLEEELERQKKEPRRYV
ncbi:hypothetical protein BJ138DRAFT_1143092 [Hygrophoropsis aurantiaca]|uniref:Uncharacterized protein n=1 Tax=Hygrophoropsis aurantiaca TaxID=72124 RepID=A0ACB8AQ32_9AGAM|nr:hypothetical protein BJ138DRAFT_1143092 [Hygrophoropsis aurantiaca]